jgi:hypothetical protein
LVPVSHMTRIRLSDWLKFTNLMPLRRYLSEDPEEENDIVVCDITPIRNQSLLVWSN